MRKVLLKSKNTSWVVKILILSFFLSITMSLLSNGIMQASNNVIIASLVVLTIVLINILFDILGTAVTAAQEEPLNSMASRKIMGSKLAIKMIKNADKVSNVCNDVIGDICGIISGAGATYIIVFLEIKNNPLITAITGLCITGLIASATVAGKSIGKFVGIRYCNDIVFGTAKFLSFFVKHKYEKVSQKEKFREKLKTKEKVKFREKVRR